MVVKITPYVGASNTACAVGSAWVKRISALDASLEAHGSAAPRQHMHPGCTRVRMLTAIGLQPSLDKMRHI
ncbi:hypothetical protein C8R45DRAFT_1095398 [Mycena sanguinolenta]|nr:hypothetical protein C8R45DRAFT_1095398 [Mycena sanguinolenta]